MEATCLIGRSGKQWHLEPAAVTSAAPRGLVARGPATPNWSLAGAIAYSADLDSDDRPHLAAVNQEGHFAYWQLDGTQWRGEELPLPAGIGVALYPHLFAQPSIQLLYLWQGADGWQLCRSERTTTGWTHPATLATGKGQPRLAATMHWGEAQALLWQRGEITLLTGAGERQLGGGLPIRHLFFSGPHLLWLAGDHTPLAMATTIAGQSEEALGTLPPGASNPALLFNPQGEPALVWTEPGGIGTFQEDGPHHLTTPLPWRPLRLVDAWGDLAGPRRFTGLALFGATCRPLTWSDLLTQRAGSLPPEPPAPLRPQVFEAGTGPVSPPAPDPRQSRWANSPTRRWLAGSRPPNG